MGLSSSIKSASWKAFQSLTYWEIARVQKFLDSGSFPVISWKYRITLETKVQSLKLWQAPFLYPLTIA